MEEKPLPISVILDAWQDCVHIDMHRRRKVKAVKMEFACDSEEKTPNTDFNLTQPSTSQVKS